MTDLLDTIHDLQREVKALKASGGTSNSVSSSVSNSVSSSVSKFGVSKFVSSSTSNSVSSSVFVASTSRPDILGKQQDWNNTGNTIRWSRVPGSQDFSLGFRTAANTAIKVRISGQALTVARGDINVNAAVFWKVSDNGTTIQEQYPWNTDPNSFITGVPSCGSAGGSWTVINNMPIVVGGGTMSSMDCTYLIGKLESHHVYTLTSTPVFALYVFPGNEHHNIGSLLFNNLTLEVENVIDEVNLA